MADKETIKEFLVKLGYEVDIKSQRDAENSVASLTGLVTKFGAALLSLYTVDSIIRLNKHFAELNETTKRIGTSVENLEGLGRAAELTGSSIGGMTNALESFSQKFRTLGKPFAEWVDSQAGTNISGMKDRVEAMIKFAERINEKYKGNWPIAVKVMETAGISEREFMALLDPMTKKIIADQNKIAENFGLKTKEMLEAGKEFAVQWSGLVARVGALYEKTVLQPDFAKGLKELNAYIDQNKDTIVDGLSAIGKVFIYVAEGATRAAQAIGLVTGLFNKDKKEFSTGGGFLEGFADKLEGKSANSQVTRDNTKAVEENTKAQRESGKGSWWQRAKDFYKEHDPAKWIAERMKAIFGAGGAGVGGSTGRGGGVYGSGAGGTGGTGMGGGGGIFGGRGGGTGRSGAGGGSGMGGGGSASAASRASMMQIAMDQLRKEGVPEDKLRAAAANLVGQADMESGLDPNKVHDSGTGYGIYGARLDRRSKMLNWLSQHGYARNSAEGQMRYMAHEAMSGAYPKTRSALMGGAMGADVTNTITGEFEAPKIINQRHGAVAQAYRSIEEAASGAKKSIVDVGKELQKEGFRVSEHPAFGGVSPVHHGRGHYEGRAIDVNMGKGVVEAADQRIGALFDAKAEQLRKQGLKVIWRQPGHFNHMHVEVPGPGAALRTPLGHNVAAYHTLNDNKRVASLGPFNTTINVPGGQHPGASTLTHAVENSMRKVAAAGIANLGTQIS